MNTDTINGIKQQLQVLYPNLFDDETNITKLDTLIPMVDLQYGPVYANRLSPEQYKLAVIYLTASALWWDEQADGEVNNLQADVLHIGMDTSGKDIYYPRFTSLLNSAGINPNWGIQLL